MESQTGQLDDKWAVGYTRRLITRIVDECPHRWPASADERRAQDILRQEMTGYGGIVRFLPCRFNTSHYAVVSLHCALATLAGPLQLVSPTVALVLHLLVGVSYFGDSQKRFFLLRRLFPRKPSQNLIVTFPARSPLRRRIVLLGHADAAPTGWIFQSPLVRLCNEKLYGRRLQFLRKPILGAMLVLLLVILQDLQWLTIGYDSRWLAGGYFLGHLFFLTITLLNLQVVWHRTVVAGANDNLTACVAIVVLARRFAASRGDDVELVLTVTAGEETCAGGTMALAREMRKHWDRSQTVVIALECLGGGELRLLQDGEIFSRKVPAWLRAAAERTAGLTNPSLYQLPAGWTDVLPFLVYGYDGVCLLRVDPATGIPANYHRPSDRPENVNYQHLVDAIGFLERFIHEVSRVEQKQDQ
jgi:hypothetical protein